MGVLEGRKLQFFDHDLGFDGILIMIKRVWLIFVSERG